MQQLRSWGEDSKKPEGLQQGGRQRGKQCGGWSSCLRSDQLEDHCRAQHSSSADGQTELGAFFFYL